MRIGHYAPHLWARGGILSYVRRLGQAQTGEGHEAFFLSRTPEPAGENGACVSVKDDRDLFAQARSLQLDVLHLHKPVDELPADRVPTVRTMHGNQGSCPTGTRYLARQGQPCNRVYGTAACLWGRYVDQCGSRNPRNVQFGFDRIRSEMRLASALQTFTVSGFLKEQMVRAGCLAENLHVIPSPAPDVQGPSTSPPREGTPHFVFLGRMVPQKGVQWLVRAAAQIRADLHIDIAGDGYLMDDMQKLARRLGIADRITFHGWLSPDDVDALIRSSRAVVVPSLWHEPAGLVTLEAAAHARPVIASRVGGIPEYALDEFATLVTPGDTAGLARSLERLAEDADLADRMGQAGARLARTRFSLSRFVDEQDRLYVQAINREILPEKADAISASFRQSVI